MNGCYSCKIIFWWHFFWNITCTECIDTSRTCCVFEFGLPRFDSVLLVLLSRTFPILTESFPFIELVLSFLELDLLCFNLVLLFFFWDGSSLFWLSPSHLWSHPSPFLSQTMSVLIQSFSFFLTQTFPILSQSFPFIFNAAFSFSSVLRFDLIAICTADTIKDGVVYRKCSLHYHERKLN